MADIQHFTAEMALLATTASIMEVSLTDIKNRIYVDMDSRQVTVKGKFGNDHDHLAKKTVLEITRYVDDVDLADHTCAIHWENGKNGGIMPVTKRDLSEDGKLLVLWELTGEFTEYSGEIVFAVHFFSVVDGNFTFHSSSDAARGRLGATFNASDHGQNNITPSEIEKYIAIMNEFSLAIDEKINGVSGGGGGGTGGVSSWNDLTDRPFYSEEGGGVEVVPEQAYEFSQSTGWFQGLFTNEAESNESALWTLTEGETYFVSWDGAIHEMICNYHINNDGDIEMWYLGNPIFATGELTEDKFSIMYWIIRNSDDSTVYLNAFICTDIDFENQIICSNSHTVSIYQGGLGETIKTLDSKYLPKEDIMQWIDAHIAEALGGEY